MGDDGEAHFGGARLRLRRGDARDFGLADQAHAEIGEHQAIGRVGAILRPFGGERRAEPFGRLDRAIEAHQAFRLPDRPAAGRAIRAD